MPVARFASVVLLSFAILGGSTSAEDFAVAPLEAPPAGVGDELAKSLSTRGFQVTGPEGPLCSLWFVASPPLLESFSPTLSIKHPFAPGGMMGLLKVEEGTEFTDFREQVLPPGLYTLRYGRQPQDGNHIGTSELGDFLLALPAKSDPSTATADDLDEVVALSTEAAGSTHPAILALRPAEKATPGEAKLVHDSTDDLWMLETAIGTEKPVSMRLVVFGFALE